VKRRAPLLLASIGAVAAALLLYGALQLSLASSLSTTVQELAVQQPVKR